MSKFQYTFIMLEMSGNLGIICIHKISCDCLKVQSAGKRTWQTTNGFAPH